MDTNVKIKRALDAVDEAVRRLKHLQDFEESKREIRRALRELRHVQKYLTRVHLELRDE